MFRFHLTAIFFFHFFSSSPSSCSIKLRMCDVVCLHFHFNLTRIFFLILFSSRLTCYSFHFIILLEDAHKTSYIYWVCVLSLHILFHFSCSFLSNHTKRVKTNKWYLSNYWDCKTGAMTYASLAHWLCLSDTFDCLVCLLCVCLFQCFRCMFASSV